MFSMPLWLQFDVPPALRNRTRRRPSASATVLVERCLACEADLERVKLWSVRATADRLSSRVCCGAFPTGVDREHAEQPISYRSLRDGSFIGLFLAMNCQATIIQSLRDKRHSRPQFNQ
jgi:hypothetical protein